MANVRSRWLRAGFLTTCLLVLLVALIFPGWMRMAIKKDREEAVAQRGVATVAILVPSEPNEVDPVHPSPPQVSVRFRGSICAVKTVPDITHLAVGDPVQIVYRVGKSGRIYVDSAESIPPATPTPPLRGAP